jgi:hypothetical protein
MNCPPSDDREQAERGTDTTGNPLDHAQRAGKRAVADMHEVSAAEIVSLLSQLEDAVLEARRKAIEECAQVAECHTGMNASGNMEYGPNMPKLIAFDIRALLSAPTEARSASEAHKEGR